MIDLEIIIKYNKFMDIILGQISSPEIDSSYRPIMRVLLYYIWRGICIARIESFSSKIESNLAFLCVATYKSFIPILQNIRLGYTSDVLILIRSLMERIALMGYLDANPSLIPTFISGKKNLYSKALSWARKNGPENFMSYYGLLSNIVHVKKEGSALYFADDRAEGDAIRNIFSNLDHTMTDELFTLLWIEIFTVNSFFSQIYSYSAEDDSTIDKMIIKYISQEDFNDFQNFIKQQGSK